jgi:hypothetical protein
MIKINKYKKILLSTIFLISKFLIGGVKKISRRPRQMITALAIGLLLGFLFGLPVGLASFIFSLFLFFRYKPTVLVIIALCLLLMCLILTFFKKSELIEQLSVWIFLLLSVSVILQIIFYRIKK